VRCKNPSTGFALLCLDHIRRRHSDSTSITECSESWPNKNLAFTYGFRARSSRLDQPASDQNTVKAPNLVLSLAALLLGVPREDMTLRNSHVPKQADGQIGCWNVISTPDPGDDSILNAVAGSGDDVWAVGYSSNGDHTVTLTMHWDGSAWSVVPSPNVGDDNLLKGVSGSGNDVWAVGYYSTFFQGNIAFRSLTLHWNGGAWSVVPSSNPGLRRNNLYAVTGSGNDVWAVGDYGDGGFTQTLTLHWDGNTWSHVLSPSHEQGNNELAGVAGSGNDVWAVGYLFPKNGTLTLHWNGSQWSLVPSPDPGISVNALYGVSGSGNNVWAVGQFDNTGDIYQTLTLHWDGSTWSHVPSPNLHQTNFSPLTGVTSSGNDVWAVGFANPDTLAEPITMHWDGSVWSLVASPAPGLQANQLNGISSDGNDVWAVGDYINSCCDYHPLTLHWTNPCGATPTPTPITPTPTPTPIPTATPTVTATPTTTPRPSPSPRDNPRPRSRPTPMPRPIPPR
jgi:protein involved in ribonucleotide reduction